MVLSSIAIASVALALPRLSFGSNTEFTCFVEAIFSPLW
jgi:hypothetical protein